MTKPSACAHDWFDYGPRRYCLRCFVAQWWAWGGFPWAHWTDRRPWI